MGLNLWDLKDVRKILLAAEEACTSTARASSLQDDGTLQYLAGFGAALRAIALAFGLSPAMFASQGQGAEEVEVDAIYLVPDRIRE